MRPHALDLVVSALVVVVLLAGNDRVRRLAVEALRPLGARLLANLVPPPEVDEAADELYRALRRERLRSDVRRLERILATDMSMSATRQIGNRLAHGWLVRELDLSTSGLPPWLDDPASSLAVRGSSPLSPGGSVPAQDWRHNPKVETLTISWRR